MTTALYAPRKWTIDNSPLITLEEMGIVNAQRIPREKRVTMVREQLARRTTVEIETLAHKIASRRRNCGEDFNEVYQDCRAFYLRERDAVIHPQMG